MLLILLLAVFLFFRLVNLNIIPVFADEAIYIFWSQQAWHDHTQRFISLSDGKPPLHTWLMIPFLKIIKDPLIAGRLLSVMAGLATLVALFLLVRKVFNQKLALTASILLSICPFLVFYNRLAVADSLLTAFAVWSFYLSLLLKEKPDLGKAFLLGFCWGGGLLTKQPALYFILLSPLVFLLERRFNFRKPFYWFLALILAFLSYNIVKLSPYSHLVSSRSYDYVLTKREFLENPFQLFWGNLKGITVWLFSYQTIFGVLLFLLGLVLLTKNNWRKAVVFFSWLSIPLLGSAAIGKIIFPRYFLFIQPWIIVFISFAINWLARKAQLFFLKANLLVYFFTFLPWLIFSGLLVFNPVKAPLIEREKDQYLTSWAAGYGIKEISEWLKQEYPQEKVYVATEGFFGTLPNGLQIYLEGFSNIEVYGIGQPISYLPEETLARAKEKPTYLVVNDSRYHGQGEHLELIESFPKPDFPFLQESLLFFQVISKRE